jgi:DNA-binding PadR family transcriptional regulator
MAFDKPSLKGRALRYLAAREYSRFELEQKLKAFEEFDGELKAALDDLEAKGFISEARVVESTLNQKANRFGAARLLNTLRLKALMQAPFWTQRRNSRKPNLTAPCKCGRANLAIPTHHPPSTRNKPGF